MCVSVSVKLKGCKRKRRSESQIKRDKGLIKFRYVFRRVKEVAYGIKRFLL